MSPDVPGLTESSVNLGYVRFTAGKGGKAVILTRSSINSFLKTADDAWSAIARMAGFSYKGMLDAYGGWAPNPASPLLKCCKDAYAKQLGLKPDGIKVEALHAGLECGELISKYPSLEAVSIGPTIRHPHSDRELIEVDTVAPVYEVVK